MANRKPTTLRIGSVSHGTMRTEDLLPAFLWETERLHLTREERAIVQGIRRRYDAGESQDESAIGSDADYWNGGHAEEDVQSLADILGNHVPAFCYFGSHPGDGADYGVWVFEDIDDSEAFRIDDTSELQAVPRDYGYALHTSDHGNGTLYRRSGNRWAEVWSVV